MDIINLFLKSMFLFLTILISSSFTNCRTRCRFS